MCSTRLKIVLDAKTRISLQGKFLQFILSQPTGHSLRAQILRGQRILKTVTFLLTSSLCFAELAPNKSIAFYTEDFLVSSNLAHTQTLIVTYNIKLLLLKYMVVKKQTLGDYKPLFLYFCLFDISKYRLPLTRCEQQISGVESDCCTNCATTTALKWQNNVWFVQLNVKNENEFELVSSNLP